LEHCSKLKILKVLKDVVLILDIIKIILKTLFLCIFMKTAIKTIEQTIGISIIASLKNQRFLGPKIIKNCFAINIAIIFGIII